MKPVTIAVAGKGGVGKTTLAALIVRRLLREGVTPVLAVDADANANLGASLGMPPAKTIGSVLHQFLGEKIGIPSGMTKEAYLDVRLNEALMEGKGADLLVMGRKEGPGCYCYPNTLLRRFVDRLMPNYRYIVIDNEAGMEHLSRRTTDKVDVLLVVTDPSVKGARTAGALRQVAEELELAIGRIGLVVGRWQGAEDPAFEEALAGTGLEVEGRIPYDEALFRIDLAGKSVMELPDDSLAAAAVEEMMNRLLSANAATGGI